MDCHFERRSKDFFKVVKDANILGIIKMLRVNPDLVNDIDDMKRTPLHFATKRGFNIVVDILLDHGADAKV